MEGGMEGHREGLRRGDEIEGCMEGRGTQGWRIKG
jgi:hypothetical protein